MNSDGETFVCPLPFAAARIYKQLTAIWERHGREGAPPPMPLVLDGWHYSSDRDKQERWASIVKWAEAHDAGSVLSSLTKDECYFVDELSTSYPEQHWRLDRFDERERPAEDAIREALERLRSNWDSVVEKTITQASRPKAITGKKARRLLVEVEDGPQPSWGGWTWISSGEAREHFTAFRGRINQLVSPVEIDHVDFRVLPK